MSSGIAEAGMRAFGRDAPTPLPVQALDHATGYIMAAAAIRGLTKRAATNVGSIARTSLARTAALLVGMGVDAAGPLAPEVPGDLDEAIETTGWGPAQRLRPPCAIAGARMRWSQPAMELGSARAAWTA